MRDVFEELSPRYRGLPGYGVELSGAAPDALTFRLPGMPSPELSPDWHDRDLGRVAHGSGIIGNTPRYTESKIPAQRIALLAGIGHVAARATRVISA